MPRIWRYVIGPRCSNSGQAIGSTLFSVDGCRLQQSIDDSPYPGYAVLDGDLLSWLAATHHCMICRSSFFPPARLLIPQLPISSILPSAGRRIVLNTSIEPHSPEIPPGPVRVYYVCRSCDRALGRRLPQTVFRVRPDELVSAIADVLSANGEGYPTIPMSCSMCRLTRVLVDRFGVLFRWASFSVTWGRRRDLFPVLMPVCRLCMVALCALYWEASFDVVLDHSEKVFPLRYARLEPGYGFIRSILDRMFVTEDAAHLLGPAVRMDHVLGNDAYSIDWACCRLRIKFDSPARRLLHPRTLSVYAANGRFCQIFALRAAQQLPPLRFRFCRPDEALEILQCLS